MRSATAPLSAVSAALALLGGTVLTVFSPGCAFPDPEEPYRVSRVGETEVAQLPNSHLSTGFWRRENLPRVRGSGVKRVAISDFTVELVTRRTGAQGSVTTKFDRRSLRGIPDQLYAEFLNHLLAFGLETSTKRQVTNTQAYGRYSTSAEVETVESPDPAVTDVGSIDEVLRLSVDRLPRIIGTDAEGGLSAVAAELRQELNVDLVIRGRFRIGVVEGRPTVEAGSFVTMDGEKIHGRLVAEHSMRGVKSAVADGVFEPEDGVFQVDPDRYELLCRFLFPRALKLAFEELQ